MFPTGTQKTLQFFKHRNLIKGLYMCSIGVGYTHFVSLDTERWDYISV